LKIKARGNIDNKLSCCRICLKRFIFITNNTGNLQAEADREPENVILAEFELEGLGATWGGWGIFSRPKAQHLWPV